MKNKFKFVALASLVVAGMLLYKKYYDATQERNLEKDPSLPTDKSKRSIDIN